MKKLMIVAVALVAALALGSIAATAGHSKRGKATVKVSTKVSLGYINNSTDPIYDPFAPAKFSGKVRTSRVKIRTRRVRGKKDRRKAKRAIKRQAKKVCVRRRVTVREAGGVVVGSDRTTRRGNYSVGVDSNLSPGTYNAVAGKKKAKKTVRFKVRHRRKTRRLKVKAKITCKRGTSPAVVVG